ncbi:MAG: hypothetical protein GY737_07400 [Desulfobacteraceae bacterium]|nr:hypothetical protein [Desulfobacteraceae bacterium]
MIEYIHINPRILKKLEELKELECATAFAAKKADAVIQALLKGKKPARAGRLTRHGDARIKKCLKYDLGQGYRLVCVKDGRDLYVLFSGSHDSCDTWLDKNRNLNLSRVRDTMERLKVKPSVHGAPEPMVCPEPEAYDDIPLGAISQRDLRAVFRGLVNP